MLEITIPAKEWYNERTNEFVNVKSQKLRLEHSLLSISKWESKWKKPFLDQEKKLSHEEIIDYFKFMTLTQNVDPNVYYAMSRDNFNTIMDYMKDKMTATWFGDEKNDKKGPPKRRPKKQIITSELIYCWMSLYGIPFECEKWHINRLLTLLRVCGEETREKKPMSKQDIMRQNAALNAARRKKLHTKG